MHEKKPLDGNPEAYFSRNTVVISVGKPLSLLKRIHPYGSMDTVSPSDRDIVSSFDDLVKIG